LQPGSFGEPWATSVREALAARSVLLRSLERWPVGTSVPSLQRLARAVDEAVTATREAGEAAHQLTVTRFGGVEDRRHPVGRPAQECLTNAGRSVPRRLHDEALRLRLCVLALDDIATEAAQAVSIGSPPLHRRSTELEPRITQVLRELRSVRSRLQA
jgi:hypothetical protein